MTTIAAVSTVLAVLPLIISAAEHYEDCFRPFVRYRRFDKEVDHFQQQLKVQKAIFHNQCRLLLESVTEHDVAASMLDGRLHPSWSDPKLDKELITMLGSSKEACCIIIEAIDGKLRDIEKESRELGAIIAEDHATESIGDKAWRRRIGKKLRFSFSQSRLDQNVSELKSLNDDFRTLSSQTNALMPCHTGSLSNNARQCNRDIEKYRVIKRASQKVYEALGRACTKHTEHLVHLCIEVEHGGIDDRATPQVKFNMAFTNLALTGSLGQGEPVWFMIDTVLEDMTPGSPAEPICGIADVAQSLKRELEEPPGSRPEKPKKTAKFAQAGPPVPSPSIPNAILSNPRMRRDFCDYLRTCFRQPLQSSGCMGILEHTGSCRHLVYPSKHKSRNGHATSLEQLISSVSQYRSAGILMQYERLHLAKSLATAVLQYHATPWLNVSWRSRDILFFGVEGKTTVHSRPDLKAPHLNVKIKETDRGPNQTSMSSARVAVRNRLLFNLGIMLIEVAYCETLQSLEQPCDLENGERNSLTEIFVARRLASSLGREMGATYGKVVKKLLECDFGCGDDLNDPKLQAVFHSDVVCALSKLEQGFRELQIGNDDD